MLKMADESMPRKAPKQVRELMEGDVAQIIASGQTALVIIVRIRHDSEMRLTLVGIDGSGAYWQDISTCAWTVDHVLKPGEKLEVV